MSSPTQNPSVHENERVKVLEEYQEAVMAILSNGHSFARDQLINEVRSVFSFSRTGPMLDETINNAIDALMREDKLGEGSTGIGLRNAG